MRKLIVLSLAVLMTGVFTIHAANDDMAVRFKLAAKLLEIMEVGKTMNRSFEAIKKMQGRMTKQLVKNAKDQKLVIKHQHEIMDLMQKELSWKNLRPDFEKLYAETYSAEELKGLVKFYQSSIGKKFIAKQPEMQKKSMMMVQKMVMRIMPKIQALTKKMQQEIISAKKTSKKNTFRRSNAEMIKSENHYYASQGYMVGQFIAKNTPDAKVLIIENRNFKKSKRSLGFIAALKKGMGNNNVNAVALNILNPPKRPKNMPKDMPMMPMMEYMTSKDFNATISANNSANVIVSVIGLPRDAAKMKLWVMPAAKRPELILVGGMGGSIKLGPAIKKGMVSAVVTISPRAKFDNEDAPAKFEDAFKKRYILIDKSNLAETRRSLR